MKKGDQVWAVVQNKMGEAFKLKHVTISLVLEKGKFQIKWKMPSKGCGSAVYHESILYTERPSDDQIAKNSDEPNEVQKQFSEAVREAVRNKSKYKYQIKY